MTDQATTTTSQAADDLTAVYRDRAYLLALLALHYPAYIAYSDRSNPEWPVITLDTPHGQLRWHLAVADLSLFPHVRRADNSLATDAFDGHSIADKHARIQARVESFLTRPGGPGQ